jgi:squalene-hopene/tetraprenyl-beta-curcumene cyclase
MSRRTTAAVAFLALALLACGHEEGEKAPSAAGGTPPGGGYAAKAGGYGYAAALGADLDRKVGDAMVRGRKHLLSLRDEASGAWGAGTPTAVGFTALATLALVGTTPRESVATDPTIVKSLEYVVAAQKPDGAIWSNAQYVNYETAVAVSALAGARVGKFASAQAKARDFLVASQIGDEDDPGFGGFPYRSAKDPNRPPDLSNAQFAATAASEAGVRDAAFWKRVEAYLAKVQNRSETNTFTSRRKVGEKDVEIVAGNDGGAAYAPGYSMADLAERPDGKYEPRSYGSMTYALLKCLLFAGVKADDPRVVAAVGWLTKNFTVDRNPGFESLKDPETAGQQGYYYYLLTMSRALAEYEKATGKPLAVADATGRPRAWRQEVAARLAELQRADGSWANPNARWEEGMPLICTAYALQTLATCQGRLP